MVGFTGCTENDAGATTSTPVEESERSTTEASERSTTETEQRRSAFRTTKLGGSLHGRPHRLEDDFDLLDRSDAAWLHAFLDVRKKYDRNVTPREDPDVAALRRASREFGVDLAVSLKWNFTGNFEEVEVANLPPPGSRRESALIEYATELLVAIDEPVDVLVLGNEPIWETPNEDLLGEDAPFVPFTRTLKEYLLEHYDAGDPRLLIGAFNRLYDDYVWNDYQDFYRRLFAMARDDDDIDGIDLHVHYSAFEEAEEMLEFARREVPDGTITATEFSPIFRYDANKDEPVAGFEGGSRFADRYGVDGDTTVTEYLEAAKHDRLSRDEMADFMETMPWYNVDFVADMYDLLDRYDVGVGTFGFLVEDDVRNVDWTEGWTPFPINCLFQPALIDSGYGAHPHYFDDFRERA